MIFRLYKLLVYQIENIVFFYIDKIVLFSPHKQQL